MLFGIILSYVSKGVIIKMQISENKTDKAKKRNEKEIG